MISSFLKENINTSEKVGASTSNIGIGIGSVPLTEPAPHIARESSLSYIAMARHNSAMSGCNKPVSARPTVTVAISIKFHNKCVDVAAHYYKDLAKMASLLRDYPGLIAILETTGYPSSAGMPVDIARLRLRNVMDYLIDHFAIPRCRFYLDTLLRPASFSEDLAKSHECCGSVTITLKYPSLLS